MRQVGVVVLAQGELDAGGEPPLGTAQPVVERGPVKVFGAFGENDGRALIPQGLLTRLEKELRFVVAPSAVGGHRDGLSVGGDGGRGVVEDVVPVVFL